jgi:phosphoribosylanthranilate isomerase
MTPTVKICGLSTALTVDAALDAGADMVGFVFFSKSPRHIDWATARALGRQARGQATIVALSVDADDDTLKLIVEALSPDLMQLHGSESPARVKEISELFGRPTMKAIGVATHGDLVAAQAYEGVADHLLIAERRRPARRQRPSVRLEPDAEVSSLRSLAFVRGPGPRHGRGGDHSERRPRRRRLLWRGERAWRQGPRQNQGVCRGGPARVRARRRRSGLT